MGIEGGWWAFTSESEYKTCPMCNGSGINTRTLDDCRVCNGSGEVKVNTESEDKNYE